MGRRNTGPRNSKLAEHNQKVAQLEKGISPDGLPLNPPRTSSVSLEHGWYRYIWISTNDYQRYVDWFRVGPQ